MKNEKGGPLFVYCKRNYVNRFIATTILGARLGVFSELREKLITEGYVLGVGRNLSHFLRSLDIRVEKKFTL